MTIKNYFIDLWLTYRWGKWRVARQHLYGPDGWTLQYIAVNSGNGEVVFCGSKRVAEGVCAANNDRRGPEPSAYFTDDSGHDTKLP